MKVRFLICILLISILILFTSSYVKSEEISGVRMMNKRQLQTPEEYEITKKKQTDEIIRLSLTFNDELLITTGKIGNNQIKIWKVKSNGSLELQQTLNDHSRDVVSIYKLSDREFVSVSRENPQIIVFKKNVDDNTFFPHERFVDIYGLNEIITSVTAIKDKFIVGGIADPPIRVFSRPDVSGKFTQTQTLSGHSNKVTCLEAFPDTMIVSGGEGPFRVVYWKLSGTSFATHQEQNGFSNQAFKMKRINEKDLMITGGYSDPYLVIQTFVANVFSPLLTISVSGYQRQPTSLARMDDNTFGFSFEKSFRVYKRNDGVQYSNYQTLSTQFPRYISSSAKVGKFLIIMEEKTCSTTNPTNEIISLLKKCTNGYNHNSNGDCGPCESSTPFIYEGKCVAKCPDGFGKMTPTSFKCEQCNANTQVAVSWNNTCETNFVCDLTKYVFVNNTCKNCLLSGTDKTIFYNGECISQCPEPLLHHPTRNTCVSESEMPAKEVGSVTLPPEPVPKPQPTVVVAPPKPELICPDGRFKVRRNGLEVCVSCFEAGLWLEQGKCVTDCSPETKRRNQNTRECLSCSKFITITKDTNNFVCTDDCDNVNGYGLDRNSEDTCIFCPSKKYVLDLIISKQCQLKCGVGNSPDTLGICKECKFFPEKKFILDGTCVEKCPENYVPMKFLDAENVCRFLKKDPTCEDTKTSETQTESEKYCLNNGRCFVVSEGKLACDCSKTEGFFGQRCDLKESDVNLFTKNSNLLIDKVKENPKLTIESFSEIGLVKNLLLQAPEIASIQVTEKLIGLASRWLDAIVNTPELVPIPKPASITEKPSLEILTLVDTAYLSSNFEEISS